MSKVFDVRQYPRHKRSNLIVCLLERKPIAFVVALARTRTRSWLLGVRAYRPRKGCADQHHYQYLFDQRHFLKPLRAASTPT
jgi:hypothetical protein